MNALQTDFSETRYLQLLRACFLSGAAAVENFRVWEAQIDWTDHLNRDEFRLMPPLYRNMAAHNVDHPQLGKFKGIARKAWYNNNLFFHALAPTMQGLGEQGIKTLALYGAAMARRYDKEFVFMYGAAACGLLVRPAQVRRAYLCLTQNGWRPTPAVAERALEGYFSARYFHLFHNAQGESVVLQWQLLPHCAQSSGDADFWKRAGNISMDGVPMGALELTDQLLHTAVYGSSPRGKTPLQRTGDVMLLLHAAAGEMNWQEFLARLQAHRVTRPARETFRTLAAEFPAILPSGFFQELDALPLANEAGEGQLWHATTSRERMAQVWQTAGRRSCATNGLQRALEFPTFLKHWWGLERTSDVVTRGVNAARYGGGRAMGNR